MHGHINLGQEQYLVEPPTPAQIGSETNFPRFPMMHVSGGVDSGGTRHEFLGATLGQTSSPGFTNMQVVMGNQGYDDGGYPDTILPALHVHLHYVQMGCSWPLRYVLFRARSRSHRGWTGVGVIRVCKCQVLTWVKRSHSFPLYTTGWQVWVTCSVQC
jgi:hypothetical protein